MESVWDVGQNPRSNEQDAGAGFSYSQSSNLITLDARPQHIDRVQHALRRLFVFEVGEGIAAGGAMPPNAGDHRLAFFGGVTGFAITVVGKVGGDHVGSVALFGFGHTERDV